MQRGEKLYVGKAKEIYATDRPDAVLISFKDDASAFNGEKRGSIAGKGAFNNRISTHLFRLLEHEGVPTHFLEQLSEREMLARKVEIIPLEIVVRNVAAGSLSKRLGLEEGSPLAAPVVETYYKRDDLGDPLLNRYHIAALNLASPDVVGEMERVALRVNRALGPYLLDRNLQLIDFKLEFGTDVTGGLLLADEISPDTCRFWDPASGQRLDKDRFRRDLGRVEDAYEEVLRRLEG